MRRLKQDELIPIKDLFEKVTLKIDRNNFLTYSEIWQSLNIKQNIKKYTFVHRVNSKQDLFIGVKAASLANDLQMLKASLIRDLNQAIDKYNRKLHEQEDYSVPYLKHLNNLIFELR